MQIEANKQNELKDWESEFDKEFEYADFPLNLAGTRSDARFKAFIRSVLSSEIEAEREAKNKAYWERNQLVAALSKIYPAWLGYHKDRDWEDDWRTIVFIEIPTKELEQKYTQGGFEVKYKRQLSWHIHDDDKKYFTHLNPGLEEWDGHTTEEKYRRLSLINKK